VTVKAGENAEKEVLRVRYSDLERYDSESIFKSSCPACKKGVLLVRRKKGYIGVLAEDNCILCGQRFVYLDERIRGEPVLDEEKKKYFVAYVRRRLDLDAPSRDWEPFNSIVDDHPLVWFGSLPKTVQEQTRIMWWSEIPRELR